MIFYFLFFTIIDAPCVSPQVWWCEKFFFLINNYVIVSVYVYNIKMRKKKFLSIIMFEKKIGISKYVWNSNLMQKCKFENLTQVFIIIS